MIIVIMYVIKIGIIMHVIHKQIIHILYIIRFTVPFQYHF